MGDEKRIRFDTFCLDLANECLWKGTEAIKLRPKAFAVLGYLLARRARLVTKEELLSAVWPETFVGEAVLKVAIGQIREALGDDPTSPRYIETAHRRGYRFVAPINESSRSLAKDHKVRNETAALLSPAWTESASAVVGREEALSWMRHRLAKMVGGESQIVFVTGEAGIGKTSLVDAFARSIAADHGIRIARGQCLEQYGTSEAYLPVLEAIGRLCREYPQFVDVLRAHAPLWLLQLPSLLSASERDLLNRQVSGATRERMLREIGGALETLTAESPLVLILEDLHWSDYSTLDLISYLARQRHSAQLMLIGTYRTVELIVSGHPLKSVKQELLSKQQCEELPLGYLSQDAVSTYLSIRFPRNRFPAELPRLIYERTEGSPLFMVNAVDYLAAEKSIVKRDACWELAVPIGKADVDVPDSIKHMIEKQVDHLDRRQQQILGVASVAGAEFSALAVAAGLGEDRALVEARCDELARRHQFIQDRGLQELPNGDTVTRYGFIHALYQNVLYDRLPTSRRVLLHRLIGEHDETLYGERAGEIAAELSMHFERGLNYQLAARYLQQAAENALRRFAYPESIVLSRRGLQLLKSLPDIPERARQELSMHITLGVPLIATEGYAAPDVGSAYTRARELCSQLGEAPEISQVLWGLWSFYLVSARLKTANQIAEEFLRVADRLPYAHLAMEVTLIHLAEFTSGLEHFDKALRLYDSEQHPHDAFHYSQNAAVATRTHGAWALWFVGCPDQALRRAEEALTLAHDLSEPHGIAHSLFFAAVLHQWRGEYSKALERAEAAIAISREHGLMLYQATSSVARGRVLIGYGRHEEAVEQIQQGLAAHQATGTELLRPQFVALLAEAFIAARRPDEGLHALEEALTSAQNSGDRYYEAELYRLRGELLLLQATPGTPDAIACFQKAVEIARKQKAMSLELRAATSLARIYQTQGRREQGRDILAKIYRKFTEGFDTLDLLQANALLDQLT